MGAALADVVRPARSTSSRALFSIVGVAAANFPDLDLLYSWITPAPLGYLLHHRGHTHTLGGVAVQIALLMALCFAVPAMRRMASVDRKRLWMLIGIALISHLVLDYGNSYGVHPFYPFGSRWYYGDAVFIFEPWLWMLLAVPLAMTATRRAVRIGLVGVVAALPLLLGYVGFVPWAGVLVLLATAALFAWRLSRVSPPRASAVGIALGAAFVVMLMVVSRFADARARRLLALPASSTVLDVIKSPDPGNPLCWSVLGVELREGEGVYVMRPATLSLAPRVMAPSSCASHRIRGAHASGDATAELIAYSEVTQSLAQLRALHERDCSVKAWLQFGRAPVIAGGQIFDQRYARGGDNFSAMPVSPEATSDVCPPRVTGWIPPRSDLLQRARPRN